MANLTWFPDWLTSHLALHRKVANLPDLDCEEGRLTFDAWRDAIAERPISRDGATAASKRLVVEPAKFKSDHFPRWIDFALEATRNLAAATNGQRPHHDLSTREGCELASCGCGRCGGVGLASVVRRVPIADGPNLVAAYCVCSLGRWILRNHDGRAKDVRNRTPDLQDAIAGRGAWRVHGCSEPDAMLPAFTFREYLDDWVAKHRVPPKKEPVPA